MGEAKKYYWLKLKKDFFKRHDITILEGLPQGKELVLLYLKLMTESIDHEGRLRFSEEIPYTPSMLASLTHSNPEFTEHALSIFESFELVVKEEDDTFFLPKVVQMIGSAADNDHAKRQQRYRERLKEAQSDEGVTESVTECVTKSDASVTEESTKSDESKSIEIRDKSKDKESVREKHPRTIIPPSLEMVQAYCEERKNGIDAQHFLDYYDARGWIVGKAKMKDWQATVRTWEGNDKKRSSERVKPKPNMMTQMMTNQTTDEDLDAILERLTVN